LVSLLDRLADFASKGETIPSDVDVFAIFSSQVAKVVEVKTKKKKRKRKKKKKKKNKHKLQYMNSSNKRKHKLQYTNKLKANKHE